MKTILGILLLCCITLGANAQLLWKISGNGLAQPSYIMGTHHMASLSIKDSIQGMQTALNSTKQVCGELIMSEMMNQAKVAEMMKKHMVTESDTMFKSLFTLEEYEMINKYAKEYLMFDIAMMPKIKPAFLSNNLLMLLYMKHVGGFNPQEQLDVFFQSQATSKGKTVNALETLEFQIDLLYNQTTLKRQAQQLLCMLNNIQANMEQTKKLTKAYMTQDLNALHQISEEEIGGLACKMTLTEREALIENRNENWVKKLPTIMAETPTFIAIGALHLIGKQGLINLLRQKGYTIEPVK